MSESDFYEKGEVVFASGTSLKMPLAEFEALAGDEKRHLHAVALAQQYAEDHVPLLTEFASLAGITYKEAQSYFDHCLRVMTMKATSATAGAAEFLACAVSHTPPPKEPWQE